MNEQHLSAHHRTTLLRIFSHPLAHNLEWAEVTSLIGSLGSVVDRHNGEYAFDVGHGQAFFRRPLGKTLDGNDVARLRTFLREAGITAEGVPSRPLGGTRNEQSQTLVVVADHHLARIFALADDGKEIAELEHVAPNDPHGFRRHLEQLLIGDSSGKSSAAAYLSEYLTSVHPDLFRRIAGTIHADLSALSEGRIKTLANGFFSESR